MFENCPILIKWGNISQNAIIGTILKIKKRDLRREEFQYYIYHQSVLHKGRFFTEISGTPVLKFCPKAGLSQQPQEPRSQFY